MKKSKLILAFLFALLISVACFAVASSAATEKETLFTLDSACNVMVDITYDTDAKPDVGIISPSNRTYNEANQTNGVQIEHDTAAKRIRFYIPDAARGSWKISYDSSLKGHLTANVVKYARDISIESFHMTSLKNNQATVDFTVQFPKTTSITYKYSISAVTLDASGNVEGKKAIYSNTATSGGKISRTLNLSGLQTYDSYYLLLEVSYEDYDSEVTHSMLSDKFSFTNSNAYAPITDYRVTLNVSTGELSVDWSHCYIYSASNYNIAVEVGGETVYADSLSGSQRSVSGISVDPSTAEIKVSLSYKRSGILSQIHSISVKPSDMGAAIATGNLTNASQAEITYSVSAQHDAYITVNSNVNEQVMLNGSGSFSVPLEEGYNDLSVKQIYSENIIFIAEKRILLDQFAPVIEFYENLSGVTTAETLFVVVGEVDSGCTFTINGLAQTVAADGTFSLPLTLVYGVNTFEFSAVDGAGNVTTRTVSIICSTQTNALGISLDFEILLLIGIGIVLLLIAVISLLVMRKKKKLSKHNVLKLVFICFLIATVALAALAALKLADKAKLDAVVNGEQFLQIAKDSIDEANRYLTAYEEATKIANQYLLYTGIAAGVAILVLVIMLILKKKTKGDDKKPKEEEAESEEEASAPEATPAPTPEAQPTPEATPAPAENNAAAPAPAPEAAQNTAPTEMAKPIGMEQPIGMEKPMEDSNNQ